MRRLACLLVAIAVSSFGAGCGDDDASGTDAGPPPSDSGGGGICATGSGAVSLEGQWAIRANLQVSLTERPGALISLCPSPQTTTASIVFKATLTGAGTSPMLRAQICDITLPVASGGVGACPVDPTDNLEVSISLGAGLQTYLPTVNLDSPVTLSNGEAGASINPAPFVFVAGAMLATPATDPLPLWNTATAGCGSSDLMAMPATCVSGFDVVRDDDTDTHPGVTLHAVSGDPATILRGDAYVALRVSPTMMGVVRNAGCIEGTLDSTLDYSIVDSDITLSGARLSTAAVIQNIPAFDVAPSSTFKMLRGDGTGVNDFDDDNDGTVTCTEIAAHATAFTR